MLRLSPGRRGQMVYSGLRRAFNKVRVQEAQARAEVVSGRTDNASPPYNICCMVQPMHTQRQLAAHWAPKPQRQGRRS
jgi:hypothetical protein